MKVHCKSFYIKPNQGTSTAVQSPSNLSPHQRLNNDPLTCLKTKSRPGDLFQLYNFGEQETRLQIKTSNYSDNIISSIKIFISEDTFARG